MSARALVLLGVFVIAGALLFAYKLYRSRRGPTIARLAVDDLGLELMAGCCAFVLFSTDTCAPCKTARRVIEEAAARSNGLTEVVTIDALARSDLAIRYDVRTVPTVFLITASGHVAKRWRDVPEISDARSVLAALQGPGPRQRPE